MRRRTRNALLAMAGVSILLLALGAVPGLLRSGDPYRVTATVEGNWTGNGTLADATAANATAITELRYPYSWGALDAATAERPGRSDPYWRGPFGLKETFTHSPFDELNALEQQHPRAVTDAGVYVHDDRRLYRLALTEGSA